MRHTGYRFLVASIVLLTVTSPLSADTMDTTSTSTTTTATVPTTATSPAIQIAEASLQLQVLNDQITQLEAQIIEQIVSGDSTSLTELQAELSQAQSSAGFIRTQLEFWLRLIEENKQAGGAP